MIKDQLRANSAMDPGSSEFLILQKKIEMMETKNYEREIELR
jgi:hypothetical protein